MVPGGTCRAFPSEADLHASHLIDVEMLHALRGARAAGALTLDLTALRYPHEPLGDRAWELRHNLT